MRDFQTVEFPHGNDPYLRLIVRREGFFFRHSGSMEGFYIRVPDDALQFYVLELDQAILHVRDQIEAAVVDDAREFPQLAT